VSGLERLAIQKLVDRANAAGIEVPVDVLAALHGRHGSVGAAGFAARYPGEDWTGVPDAAISCCMGVAMGGLEACTCWFPVFEVEQAPIRPPACAEDLEAQPRMCGDCAYRKGSPERSDPYVAEQLLELPSTGQVFWCHADMVRPVAWRHPQLGPEHDVPGEDSDWRPAMANGIPYRADGRPGLLCAGWAQRAARVANEKETPDDL
jgi:hypothetical protein